MRILITGASGFLGKIVVEKFKAVSAEVLTLGRSYESIYRADLTEEIPDLPPVDRVIHIAGKAHTNPKTEAEKKEYFKVNENGTIHLCGALQKAKKLPKQFVFISTVAVYGLEYGVNINESYPLNGNSDYARSKIKSEDFLLNWGKNNGVKVLILRLPLVAGPNPKGNLKVMIDAIRKGRYFSVGGGRTKKSMVLAEDVANLIVGADTGEGIYNLTDGYHPSFRELEEVISQHYSVSMPKVLPLGIAKLLGNIGDLFSFFPVNSNTIKKLTMDLTFDDNKAKKEIGWQHRSVLDHLFEK